MKEACLIVSCFITEPTQMYYSIQNESHDHYLESTQLNISITSEKNIQEHAAGWGFYMKGNPSFLVSHGAHYMLCKPLDGHMGGTPPTSLLKGTSHILSLFSHLLCQSILETLLLLLPSNEESRDPFV